MSRMTDFGHVLTSVETVANNVAEHAGRDEALRFVVPDREGEFATNEQIKKNEETAQLSPARNLLGSRTRPWTV